MSVTKWFLATKKINKNTKEIKELVKTDNVNPILPNPNSFIADPFLFKYKNEYYVFYEDWDYNYGVISCSKLDENLNIINKEICLDIGRHLSFPCLFEYNNSIFMVPESGAGGIDVYECKIFPHKWEKQSTIINGIHAIDPVFHFHDNLIYIFTNNNNYINIYTSDSLFGDYKSHPINKNHNNTNARNGGNIISFNGDKYRVAQVCVPHYGYSIALYRIDLLTQTDYKETLVHTIDPSWFPELTGTHTLNICDDIMVIDGRLRIESPHMKQHYSRIGQVWISTDEDKFVNNYIKNLCDSYRNQTEDEVSLRSICSDILKMFNNKTSDYGKILYNTVSDITKNFTINKSFDELESAINSNELDFILHNYCCLNKNIFFIIVWPVTYSFDDDIRKIYNKYGSIKYRKEIVLKNNGFKNILHFIADKRKHPRGQDLWFAKPHCDKNPLTVYVFETKYINIPYEEKINYLCQIFNDNKDHISSIHKRGGINNLYCTTIAKRECRNLLKNNNRVAPVSFAPDLQYSHHINDEHHETIELSRIFFNRNSINAINNCKIDFCKSFETKYKIYSKFVNENIYGSINDFCIDNSSVLSQYGIRESRDIDYIHSSLISIPKQIPDDEVSSHNYVIKSIDHNINIDELVYNPHNHFWFKNVKFLSLESLYKLKILQRNNDYKKNKGKITNTKASNDVVLMSNFFADQCIVEKYTFKTIKQPIVCHTACHFRKIYEDYNFFYKMINFKDSISFDFQKNIQYEIYFKKAMSVCFFDTLIPNDVSIFFDRNSNQYGYKYKKLNDIKTIDTDKMKNLINRLIFQTKMHGLFYTDLTIDNVKEYENQYFIIDLDNVTSIEIYKKFKDWAPFHKCSPHMYEYIHYYEDSTFRNT